MSTNDDTSHETRTGHTEANETLISRGDDFEVGDALRRSAMAVAGLVALLSILGSIGNLVVFDSAIGEADEDIVQTVADNRTSALDTAAPVISALSDTWTVIGVVVGASTMLWVAGRRRHALTVVLAVAVEFLTFLAVGAIIDRDRPEVEALGSVPSTPSFPSGHTAAAFVLYAVLVLVARSLATRSVPKWLWTVPVLIGLMMAFARVYEGVHHPLDVVAGLLVGVGALVGAGLATGVLVVERSPFRLRLAPDVSPS